MPKQATEPPAPIRISTNTIWEGKFYTAYAPLPFASVADMPETLRPLVVTDLPEAPDDEPRGAFELNTPYQVTSDDRLGRSLRRQVAQLEAENEREEWIEEQADAPLPPEIAAGLQEAHEDSVALQTAQAAADAALADAAATAAAAFAEPVRLYVKRGGRHYAPADKARLQADEAVFVRQPDGGFECIGTTDSRCELPDLPITL